MARVLALASLLCCLIGVALLHALRTDLSPVGNRLSEYANGPHGWLMTVVFAALAGGLLAVGVALRATTSDQDLIALMVPAAAFVAAIAAIISGIFRTGVSSTSEVIHSRASALATCSTVALALASSWPPARRRLGRPRDLVGMALAGTAACVALLSPLLHETRWTGLGQRVLWSLLLAWLLWTVGHGPARRGAGAVRDSGRGDAL